MNDHVLFDNQTEAELHCPETQEPQLKRRRIEMDFDLNVGGRCDAEVTDVCSALVDGRSLSSAAHLPEYVTTNVLCPWCLSASLLPFREFGSIVCENGVACCQTPRRLALEAGLALSGLTVPMMYHRIMCRLAEHNCGTSGQLQVVVRDIGFSLSRLCSDEHSFLAQSGWDRPQLYPTTTSDGAATGGMSWDTTTSAAEQFYFIVCSGCGEEDFVG